MAWFAKKEVEDEKILETIKKPESIKKAPEFVVPAASEAAKPAVEQLIGPPEVSPEQAAQAPSEQVFEAVPPVAAATPVAPPPLPVVKDEVTQEIESILSEDLTDLFLKMSPEQQEEFRVKGEETASKIRVLLSSAKVGVKKILGLITEWLRLIPGVNKFFLEQEAKIKTDKILLNSEDFRKEGKL